MCKINDIALYFFLLLLFLLFLYNAICPVISPVMSFTIDICIMKYNIAKCMLSPVMFISIAVPFAAHLLSAIKVYVSSQIDCAISIYTQTKMYRLSCFYVIAYVDGEVDNTELKKS